MEILITASKLSPTILSIFPFVIGVRESGVTKYYQIKQTLLHKLIAWVLISLMALLGSVVSWVYYDNKWKANTDATLSLMTSKFLVYDSHIKDYYGHIQEPCHGVACAHIDEIRKRPR